MKIAISGSWKQYKVKDWKLKQSKEEFARACFNIGFKIAEHRHSVIVGSQSPNTADLYMVEGVLRYVEKYGKESFDYPLVHILRPKDELFPFRKSQEQFSCIFSHYRKEQPDWDTAHLLAAKEADVVLIIGGAESSRIAGLAAHFSGKRVVPVGSFGGAARKLLDYLLEKRDAENREKYKQLYKPWTDYVLQVTLDLLRVYDYPKIFIIHGRSDDWKDLKNYLESDLRLPEPIVMEHEFGEGKTLAKKFEHLAFHTDATIAVCTPDDIGALVIGKKGEITPEENRKYKFRARQNVWLEIGYLWGALDIGRIMVLYRGEVEGIERPSNFGGIEVYRYDKSPREKDKKIRLFISKLKHA